MARPSNWCPRQIPKIPRAPPPRRGPPGAVGENPAGGPAGQDVGGRRGRRHDLDGAVPGEVHGDVALHPVVDGDDARQVGGIDSGHGVRLGNRDLADEVDPGGTGLGRCCRPELHDVRGAEGARHRPGVAQQPRESPGVDPGDPGHAVLAQQRIQAGLGTMVAVAAGQLAHHDAATEGAA